MLDLALAILCSALVSVLMRLGSDGETARRPMLAVNYLTCAAVSLAFLKGGLAPAAEGLGFALGLGLAGGALYLGAFLLLQKNVRESGVTLSSAFMKLGVIVPTALGLAGEDGGRRGGKLPSLVLLMLYGGMADGLSKIYEARGNPALGGHFLCFVFAFALILCAGLCAAQRQRPTGRDWLFGALLGVPNYFSSRFLLRALAYVPASLAYPAFSCGAILLTAVIGRLLFHERPGRRQWAAVGVVLAALALLNI